MVNYMDGVVGKLVDALRRKQMWDDTLMLFFSDNGGPVYYPGSANNHPLKGGKLSDWEGGVRVNAFLAGGALPPHARGKKLDALVHVADWYATFAALARVQDPTADAEAAAAGLPAVDSVNVWPLIADAKAFLPGGAASPRTEVQLSSQALIQRGGGGELYKLITGWMTSSGWTGPSYPNRTGHQPLPSPTDKYPPLMLDTWAHDCGEPGCLYDVAADETEHHNLAEALPDVARKLKARLDELNMANYDPDRGAGDPAACRAAERYGGFYGPFVFES